MIKCRLLLLGTNINLLNEHQINKCRKLSNIYLYACNIGWHSNILYSNILRLKGKQLCRLLLLIRVSNKCFYQ